MNERNNRMLEMYRDEGLTMQAIGAEFGVSESRVCQILSRCGYTGRNRRAEFVARQRQKQEAAEWANRKRRERRNAIVQRMWLAGESTAVIGTVLDVDRSVVGRIAKALGLPQRSKGGWGSSRERGSSGAAYPAFGEALDPDLPALLEVEALTKSSTQQRRCRCGGEPEVRCLCGRVRCDIHAVMTVDGPRCEVCLEVA